MYTSEHLVKKREAYIVAYYALQDIYNRHSLEPATKYQERWFFLAGLQDAMDAIQSLIYKEGN